MERRSSAGGMDSEPFIGRYLRSLDVRRRCAVWLANQMIQGDESAYMALKAQEEIGHVVRTAADSMEVLCRKEHCEGGVKLTMGVDIPQAVQCAFPEENERLSIANP